MTTPERNTLNTQIYDEASNWFVEFRTGDVDPGARKAFHEWLRTSPQHMRAYLELAAIWNEGPHLDRERRYDSSELSSAANIVALVSGTAYENRETPNDAGHGDRGRSTNTRRSVSAEPRRAGERRLRAWLALAATVLFSVGATLGAWFWTHRGLYETDIGEQRSITLADGSRIELNAHSEIREAFSNSERRVDLIRGQALFQVTKDKARPFIVRSAGMHVRAVGTQFDVYRRSSGTTVTVVEGTVAVASAAAAAHPVGSNVSAGTPNSTEHDAPARVLARAGEFLLGAGEQAIVTPSTTIKAPKPNIAAATAWTQRRLVFESTKLGDVAEEFNRYNPRPLRIEGAELNDFRITGIFSSTDPGALIRFLQARPGITVTEGKDDIVVTRTL